MSKFVKYDDLLSVIKYDNSSDAYVVGKNELDAITKFGEMHQAGGKVPKDGAFVTQWIPVTQRLPDNEEPVLVRFEGEMDAWAWEDDDGNDVSYTYGSIDVAFYEPGCNTIFSSIYEWDPDDGPNSFYGTTIPRGWWCKDYLPFCFRVDGTVTHWAPINNDLKRRAFIVSKTSELYEKFFIGVEEKFKFDNLAIDFFERNGLSCEKPRRYHIGKKLDIMLTPEERVKYEGQLIKRLRNDGFSEFLSSSPMQRDWRKNVVNKCNFDNMKLTYDWWEDIVPECKEDRLWNSGDVLYGFLEYYLFDINLPEYVEEIDIQDYMEKEKEHDSIEVGGILSMWNL